MPITFYDLTEAKEYARTKEEEGYRVKLLSVNKIHKVVLLGRGKVSKKEVILPRKVKVGSVLPMMMAHKASPDILEKIEKDKNLGVGKKYDGWRELLYLGKKENSLIARSGNNHSDNVPHIQDTVVPKLFSTVLDIEAIAPSSQLGDTTSIFGSSPEVAIEWQKKHGNLRIIAFDILRYKGADITKLPLEERRQYLKETVDALRKAGLKEIRMEKLHFRNKRQAFDNIIKRGGEGVMIKDITKPYAKGERTRHWLKVKKQNTWDVVITGFTPGSGKYKDMIGAIKYGVYDKSGNLVEVGTSSGMTDKDRYAFAKSPKKYIGKVIELSGQEIGVRGAIRHPNFKRIREDKKPWECLLSDLI